MGEVCAQRLAEKELMPGSRPDRHHRGDPAGEGSRPVGERAGRGLRHACGRCKRLRSRRGVRPLHRDGGDRTQAGHEPRRPAPHQCRHRTLGERTDCARGARLRRDRGLESPGRDGLRGQGNDRLPARAGGRHGRGARHRPLSIVHRDGAGRERRGHPGDGTGRARRHHGAAGLLHGGERDSRLAPDRA